MHLMAIDTYILSNPDLRKLKLICINMNHETLEVISRSIVNSKIQSLALDQNQLRDNGAATVANIITQTKTLSKLKLDSCEIKLVGMMKILDALKLNSSIVKFKAAGNHFQASRRMLAIIGDLVVYHNRTLRFLNLSLHD
jgi:hypothetical protein